MTSKLDKREIRFSLLDYIADQIHHFGTMPMDMIFNIDTADEFIVDFSEYSKYLTEDDYSRIEEMILEKETEL